MIITPVETDEICFLFFLSFHMQELDDCEAYFQAYCEESRVTSSIDFFTYLEQCKKIFG